MAHDDKRKLKPRYVTHSIHKSRKDGYEAPHTVWIREDLWMRLKTVKRERGKSLKYLVNEALYNLLMQDELEKQTGEKLTFQQSEYYPEHKVSGKKFSDD